MKAGGDLRAPDVMADNRYTSDYLVAEVLSRVPAATQDFLLQTSILDRLSGPLCDAVAPPADPSWDGRSFLEWLAAENVFTFSLDPQGAWYRYHHLFQKLLRTQLERRRSAEEIAALHVRAAEWFAQRGLIQEAIEHALAAGDDLMAVELVEKHRYPMMNAERWRQLEQWLGMLPKRLIDRRPELLMLEAWIIQNQWRFRDLPAYLDRIEALLHEWPGESSECARLQAEVDTLRSLALYYALDWKRSFACAERALAALPLEYSIARGSAWMYYANGRVIDGDMAGAIEAARQGLKEDRVHGNAFSTRLYIALCQLYWMQGDPTNLFLAATQLLQSRRAKEPGRSAGLGPLFQGLRAIPAERFGRSGTGVHRRGQPALRHARSSVFAERIRACDDFRGAGGIRTRPASRGVGGGVRVGGEQRAGHGGCCRPSGPAWPVAREILLRRIAGPLRSILTRRSCRSPRSPCPTWCT